MNDKKSGSKEKKTVSPKYTLADDYKKYNEYYTIFARKTWDKTLSSYQKSMYENVSKIVKEKKEGYTHFDHAWSIASWTVHDYFQGAFSWEKLGNPSNVMAIQKLEQMEINDKNIDEVTKKVKTVARSFGASLVGVTNFDDRWIYSNDRQNKSIELPEWVTNIIVIAIEMDSQAFSTSPSFVHGSANGFGYSKMAVVVSSLAEFIRLLGYRAIPAGNNIGLSIPMAIDAGLGQLGRNGLLTTKEFGSRLRLCKVFTDMPLIHDEPIDFGLTDYCRKCRKCAEACEVDAISFEKEPSFDVECKSNNKGIFRWAIDADKCYEFWVENGGECSTCVTACPFTIKGKGKKDYSVEDFWRDKMK